MPFSVRLPQRLLLILGVIPLCSLADPSGRAVVVNGKASLDSRALKAGDPVNEGQVVRTEEKSSAKLLMVDRTTVDIGESTEFTITRFRSEASGSRDVDVKIDFGTVRATVNRKLDKKSRFFIRTRASVLAVRGTSLVIRDDTVTVVEGTVTAMTKEGPVLLTTGQQILFPQGADGRSLASQRRTLSPAQLHALDQQTAVGLEEKDSAIYTSVKEYLHSQPLEGFSGKTLAEKLVATLSFGPHEVDPSLLPSTSNFEKGSPPGSLVVKFSP